MYQGYATTTLRNNIQKRRAIAKQYKIRATLLDRLGKRDGAENAYDQAVFALTSCIEMQREIDRRAWAKNGPAAVTTGETDA